jgi:hypothetical protein
LIGVRVLVAEIVDGEELRNERAGTAAFATPALESASETTAVKPDARRSERTVGTESLPFSEAR